jgi:hypothetical protein
MADRLCYLTVECLRVIQLGKSFAMIKAVLTAFVIVTNVVVDALPDYPLLKKSLSYYAFFLFLTLT